MSESKSETTTSRRFWSPVERVNAVRRALEQCAVPVCVAPGNHDYCTDSSPWLTQSWPENVHIFTGGPDHIDLPSLDCRVYGAGYRSMDCPGLLEGFRAEGDAKWRVGVFHGDPLSLSSPCCPVTAAQVRERLRESDPVIRDIPRNLCVLCFDDAYSQCKRSRRISRTSERKRDHFCCKR